MAYKPQKVWSDDDDCRLMRLHGTMPNRQVAKAMGRTIHSIDCRIRILRNLGIMPQPEEKPLWSEADDRYLVENYIKFTAAMLAEDLGRSVEAVNSRLRRLKRSGMQIGAMPRGRGRSKLAEAARAEVKDMDVSLASEREAMRDEVMAYLSEQVKRKALDLDKAKAIAQSIRQNVLQAPEWRFKRYAQKPVAVIVQEAA
jgi:DNA-binding Lrp family transcriptional regulator